MSLCLPIGRLKLREKRGTGEMKGSFRQLSEGRLVALPDGYQYASCDQAAEEPRREDGKSVRKIKKENLRLQ